MRTEKLEKPAWLALQTEEVGHSLAKIRHLHIAVAMDIWRNSKQLHIGRAQENRVAFTRLLTRSELENNCSLITATKEIQDDLRLISIQGNSSQPGIDFIGRNSMRFAISYHIITTERTNLKRYQRGTFLEGNRRIILKALLNVSAMRSE